MKYYENFCNCLRVIQQDKNRKLKFANINEVPLKGTATLMISMFHMKELSEPRVLIPVSSKSVENYGSYGRLNICKWTLMEAAIL